MGKGGSILIPLNYQNHLGSGYHQACLADKETEAPEGGVSSRECISLSGEAGMEGQVTWLQSPHFQQPELPLCLAGR